MKMETAGAPAESSPSMARGGLSKKSSSFRLRCSSLNSVRLRRVFDLFDKNGDGLITADQIRQALVLLGLDSDPSQSALDSIVKSFIKDDNAGLTFDDFVALHKSLDEVFFEADDGKVSQGQRHQRHDSGIDFDVIAEEEEEERLAQEESDLSEAFKVFDEDGDGFISARELQVVLNKLGLPEAKEIDRVQQMISSVDTNKDGLVDFFEFKDMMRGVIVRSG
ncbi:Calcium-binding protein CML42-like protein [Drosera capensis]